MGYWIKLYAEFLHWEWFTKPEMVQLFTWLLLNASVTDRAWRGMTIKRGQLVTTYAAIEQGTRLTPQRVRTCINRLKSTHEITIKSTNKYSLITICNYERYQDGILAANEQNNEQINGQITNKQRTNNERSTVTNYSNIERKKERIIITSSTRAREHGFVEQMKSEQYWLEVMAKNYRTDVPTIKARLDEFVTHCECRDIEHRDYSDAKRHFNDWLNKRKESEAKSAPRRGKQDLPKNINDLWQ